MCWFVQKTSKRCWKLFIPIERLETLYDIIIREIEILEIENKINLRVKKQVDKVQREYYLREQMKAIQKELGESDGIAVRGRGVPGKNR
jgi:ATP-dependent Lon protease